MNKLKGIDVLAQTFKTFIIASLGGWVASFLHLPIPWLLGSMFAVMIGLNLGLQLQWPRLLGNIGMMIIGYTIGLSFSIEALQYILSQLPTIFMMTLLLVAFSLVFAFVISRIGNMDLPAVIIGSIPGGLSQMILLAEEMKNVNVSVVAFFQILRLLIVVVIVPLIVFSSFLSGTEFSSSLTSDSASSIGEKLFPELLIFIPIVFFFSLIAKKIRFPTPFLVGPIFGSVLFNLFVIQGSMIPDYLLDLSQLLLGAYFGLLLDFKRIENKKTMTFFAGLGGFLLIAFTAGLSLIVSYKEGIPYITSMLSLAPGGMDQMAVIGAEINADLSIIAGYQLFRLFFIYFVVPPLLKWSISIYRARKEKEKIEEMM